MLFLSFFAAVFGRGFYITASAPDRTGGIMFALVIMGMCCFSAIALIGMLLINAVWETRRVNAALHALTDTRLLSLGPSAGGNGVLFRQWDGKELREIRIIAHRDGTEDLVLRCQFLPNGKPVAQGWPALPDAEAVCGQIRRVFPGMSVSRFP